MNFKKLFNKFEKIVQPEEISAIPFLRALRLSAYELDGNAWLLSIVNVRVFSKFGEIICEIETHRPGILIGLRGATIAHIKEKMEWLYRKEFTTDKRPITISIVESRMFSFDAERE